MASPVPTPRKVPVTPRYVMVHEYGLAIFWWPLVLVPLVLGGLLSLEAISSETAQWFFVGTILLTMTATTFNLDRITSLIILLLTGLIIIGGLFAGLKWDIPIFQQISDFLGSLDLQYNSASGYLVSFGAFFLTAIAKSRAYLDGRWRFGHNQFEHIKSAASDRSIPRAGMSVNCVYPDLLKFLLGFTGQIQIRGGARGSEVVATLDNVFFAPWKNQKIHAMLDETAMVGSQGYMPAAEVLSGPADNYHGTSA